MHLIADSGSTKTHWRLTDDRTTAATTIGYSPQYTSTPEIIADLKASLLPQLPANPADITTVHFYGTGCSTPRTKNIIHDALVTIFPHAIITIDHDLLGAARALCGKKAGIACILGTGANACAFDGVAITDNVTSVGFMLGDEGGGGYLGRKLVRAYFYRELPDDLSQAFAQTYHLTIDDLLLNVYKRPAPNRYLAQFTKFLSVHRSHPYVETLLQQAFQDFLDSMVLKFDTARSVPIHFTGSIAFHFQAALRTAVEGNHLMMGKVIEHPIDALVSYYSE